MAQVVVILFPIGAAGWNTSYQRKSSRFFGGR